VTPLEVRLALSEEQIAKLEAFHELAVDFNRRHNLYSKGSVPDFWNRHILHSLAIASRGFPAGSRVVDWGTGGGLPGIPLAILFPEVEFVLVDAVEKKVRAVNAMVRRLGLPNAVGVASRAEQVDGQFNYAVSRATAPLADLWQWTDRVLEPAEAPAGCWSAHLITLKGGDLTHEKELLLSQAPDVAVAEEPISDLLPDAYFAEKALVTVARI
jgi:16S rRNA (guanine527-N7)-methyltransferase